MAILRLLLVAAVWTAPATAAELPCRPAPAAPDGDLSRLIDPIVDEALADGFAGGVAVMRDGALVYDRVAGFSDARGTVPVTGHTLFHVASISKYVTAVLTLAAIDEGRASLEAPLGSLAPGTRLAGRGTTLLDLLAHRAGLGSSYAAEGETEAARALAALDEQPVDGEAGGSFRYSNDGYDLLAILLERLYDRPYEELAREKLFAPACLDAPSFWGVAPLADPQVVGQPLRPPGRRLRRRNYGMIGSAGLLITAADLARFERAVSSGRLLSPTSRAALIAPRGEMSLGQATLGAFLVDHPELGPTLSARGYEDRGDNAILNHYLDHAVILAVVTSKGPAEETGAPPFRSRLAGAIEQVLVKSSLGDRASPSS